MPQKQTRKPKSHRGCTACRASKRKCSEDKPACENCIRDGKVCEYDIDVLFRIQTYDGTQQPNRRMRQIITPLPKITEQQRQKSRNPFSPMCSSPAADTPRTDEDVSQGHSLTTPFLLRKKGLPPRIDKRRRQLSHPHSSPYQLNSSTIHNVTQSTLDPSAFPSFLSSISQQSLTPSASSMNSYAFSMIDSLIPLSMNVNPSITVMSEDESVFIAFYLREMPAMLPFSELFPSACNDIWAMSVAHIPLTSSILAIASYLVDWRAGIPLIHGLAYLEKALTQVQDAISVGIVDEGLIAAVFLLAFLSTLSGDYKSSRGHLQGMAQLLHFYHQRRASCIPPRTTPFHTNGHPIIMLLWRMAIRMEYHVSFYNSGQGAPIFPIVNTSQENNRIEWITQIIDKAIPNGVDWALASFALDDLMNRGGHLSHKLTERPIDSIDRAFLIQELVEKHQSWKRRPVVSQAIIESLSSSPDTTINPFLMHNNTAASFLNYGSPRIHNKIYATLLIRHFMVGIYLSLTADPCPGPVSPERLQAATDICRYFVALYGDPQYSQQDPMLRPVDNCMALITAAFTFREENHPAEFGYCVRTLTTIARDTGFPALMDVVEILKATHNDAGCDKNWAKGYEKMAQSPAFRWDWFDNGLVNEVENLSRMTFWRHRNGM